MMMMMMMIMVVTVMMPQQPLARISWSSASDGDVDDDSYQTDTRTAQLTTMNR